MARHRLSPEEKFDLVVLGTNNPGKVSELCRQYGVYRSSFYRWQRKLYFDRETIEDAVQDFVMVNCMWSLPPRAERSLREVFYRLPPRAATTILHNPNILVMYTDSISTRAHSICYPPHPEAIQYWLHIVTLTPEIETMSDEALVGAIAHEFAHVFLKHDAPPLRCEDKEEFMRELNRGEEEADNLAKKWGFGKEIEASRQWGHSQAYGAD